MPGEGAFPAPLGGEFVSLADVHHRRIADAVAVETRRREEALQQLREVRCNVEEAASVRASLSKDCRESIQREVRSRLQEPSKPLNSQC